MVSVLKIMVPVAPMAIGGIRALIFYCAGVDILGLDPQGQQHSLPLPVPVSMRLFACCRGEPVILTWEWQQRRLDGLTRSVEEADNREGSEIVERLQNNGGREIAVPWHQGELTCLFLDVAIAFVWFLCCGAVDPAVQQMEMVVSTVFIVVWLAMFAIGSAYRNVEDMADDHRDVRSLARDLTAYISWRALVRGLARIPFSLVSGFVPSGLSDSQLVGSQQDLNHNAAFRV